MGNYKYKAFISYSHTDDRWSRWLHRRLENYPMPKNIIGKTTPIGVVPKRLHPIFRDREELSAADNLGVKIEKALSQSENLIIICSPAAARSHWVNQEVLYFKRHNRGAQIFTVIIEGEPFASNKQGREDEECFPPALRYKLDDNGALSDIPAEPLAADLRDHADGKRLGVLKLVSGIIGVGLDEVIQRDMRKGRRRVTAITSSALATVLAMGTLTGFALDARQEAEQRRNAAEENIEFMITDLKKELEPVGRLSALKVVGERAETYYAKHPISEHSDEALGRRARVFHLLGSVFLDEAETKLANDYFKRAYDATNTLVLRNADNPNRVFEHAQSAFYLGHLFWTSKKYDEARPYFDEYIFQAEKLELLEPNSLRAKQEVTYAYTNLGTLLYKQGHFAKAHELYSHAIPAYVEIVIKNPKDVQFQLDLADAYGWLADASAVVTTTKEAFEYRMKQKEMYETLLKKRPKDRKIQHQDLSASIGLGTLALSLNKIDLAEKIADEALEKSRELWENDPNNINWVKNFGFIQLLKIEITLTKSDFSSCRELTQKLKKFEDQAMKRKTNDASIIEEITQKRLFYEKKLSSEFAKNPFSSK